MQEKRVFVICFGEVLRLRMTKLGSCCLNIQMEKRFRFVLALVLAVSHLGMFQFLSIYIYLIHRFI